MSLTFNSNNNYSVEIITEADLANPSTIEYSSNTNTPFVTMKIIPTSPQTQPVLAGNIKFDDQIPDFSWNGLTQTPQSCQPPPTPHMVSSQIQHTTGIFLPSSCSSQGLLGFTGLSNNSQQGPYTLTNSQSNKMAQLNNIGVTYREAWVHEVYMGDNGELVNDNFSPATDEQYNHWQMWNPGVYGNSNVVGPSITNEIYPVYLKVFVFLEFDSNNPITLNTTLQIDIDEVEPNTGCTDSTALNYDPLATVDDGSCTYTPTPKNIIIKDVGNVALPQHCVYIDPPFPSQVISMPQLGLTTQNLSGLPVMPKNLAISQRTAIVNGQTIIPSMTLANTYFDGDHVNEVVHVKLYPRQKVINTQNLNLVGPFVLSKALSVFDFPLPGGPYTNYQASLPAGDPLVWMGQALNNLTGAGVSILNNGVVNNGRPSYTAVGHTNGFSPNQAEQTKWWPIPHLDLDGNMPTTILTWDVPGNSIECVQPDGSVFNVGVEGIWAEEFYVPNTSGQVSDFAGLEWFPKRIDLYIKLDFTMPNHEVVVNLDLQHNNVFINWI